MDSIIKIYRPIIMFFIFLVLKSLYAFGQEIQVTIRGRDDGIKTNKQQDYKEASMNAKLEAIERAGTEIKSITKVVNFKLKYDMVESKAEGILLPGYQILDIGYQTDGTYLVILSGKLKVGPEKDNPSELFNIAQLYYKQGKFSDAKEKIEVIIKDYPTSDFSPKAIDLLDKVKLEMDKQNQEMLKKAEQERIANKIPINETRTWGRGANTYEDASKAQTFNTSFRGNDDKYHNLKIIVDGEWKGGFFAGKKFCQFDVYIDGRQTFTKRFSKNDKWEHEIIDSTISSDRIKIYIKHWMYYGANTQCKVERLDF